MRGRRQGLGVAMAIAIAGCGPLGRAPAASTTSSGAVQAGGGAADGAPVLLSNGATPRRVLRYPRAALVREVGFTWRSRAHTADSHMGLDDTRVYGERRLRGILVRAGLGSGASRLVLTHGTVDRAPPTVATSVPVDLATELPLSLDLRVEPASTALAIAPIEDWRERWQGWLYRRAIVEAMPTSLPDEPVGVGARWQIAMHDPEEGRSVTTWEVAAIDGTRVSLVGEVQAGARRDDASARRSRAVRVEVQTTIDFASFTVASTVERADESSSWTPLTSASGSRSEWSSLTIGPTAPTVPMVPTVPAAPASLAVPAATGASGATGVSGAAAVTGATAGTASTTIRAAPQ